MENFRNYDANDADYIKEEIAYYRSLVRDSTQQKYDWLRREDIRILSPGQNPFSVTHEKWTVAKFYFQNHRVRYRFKGKYRLRSLKDSELQTMSKEKLGGKMFVWDEVLRDHPEWFEEQTDWKPFNPGDVHLRWTAPMFHQVIVSADDGVPGSVFLDNDKTP